MTLGHDGYTTDAIYKVTSESNENSFIFSLKYEVLKEPFIKTYPVDKIIISKYNKIILEGFSIGAYEKDKLAGAVIVESRKWNNSLLIEFIEVAEAYRGKGIGSLLLSELFRKFSHSGYRLIELETQNTNLPAINFYRKNGFEITGLNLTLYDIPGNKDEIAFYMSKQF